MTPSVHGRHLRTLLVAGLVVGSASAQVRFPGAPRATDLVAGTSLPTGAWTNVPTIEFPALDAGALLLEDAMRDEAGPLRYGLPIPLNLDFESAADWQPTPDGRFMVGRLRFEAEDAKSIGLEFSRFSLPRGATAFLYDDTMQNVYGAYTSQNLGGGGWSIEPFPGEVATLEVSIPTNSSEDWRIALSDLIYDYADFFEMEATLNTPQSGDGSEGGCNVDVNCPAGDPYDLEKRAVVRTVSGGGLCSGSLINNVRNDGTQYMYTAFHCGQNAGVNVRFKYQTPGCGTGQAPTNFSVSGATQLETDSNADGRLMRINTPIPASYEPYFPGWSRSNVNLTFGMGMHHPGGAPKCISIDNDGGGKSTGFFIGIGNVKVWNMFFQVGGSQGGSSGSPLFDQNLVIRGTLTGGPDICQSTSYGRFHTFWNDVDLAPYLDPDGTGLQDIPGYDPLDVIPTLDSIAPSTVPTFGAGDVVLTGTGLNTVSTLVVDGVELTAPFGFTIANAETITFRPPGPSGLGTVDVYAEGTGGNSNTVQLTYVETESPGLAGGTPIAASGGTFTWAFGGPLGDVYFLLVTLNDDTTVPAGGIDILANFVILDQGFLDPATGLGSLLVPVPFGFSFNTLVAQLVTFDGAVLDASNVLSTLIL